MGLLALALAPASVRAQRTPGTPGGAFADRRERRADRLRAMADAYRAAGDVVSATAWYEDALGEDPGDRESWRGLAATWAQRGDVRRAIDTLRRALRHLPDDRDVWLELAALEHRGGDADAAGRSLRTLVERRPRDPIARAALARHARERGAWSEALAAYRVITSLAGEGVEVAPALRAEAEEAIPALVLLLGSLDPVAGAGRCEDPSPVRRALAACAPS